MHFEKLTLDANSSAFSQAPYPFGIDPVRIAAGYFT